MATKKYIVKLSLDERQELEQLVKKGRASGERVRRAQSLLKADAGEHGPRWTDLRISEAFEITTRALQGLRKRAVELGPQVAVHGRHRGATHSRKIDGIGQATLHRIACSAPPTGYSRWTLKLLANRMVELEVVDSVSRETVRRHLKGGSTEFGRT